MTEVQTTETQNSNPYSAFIPEIWSQKLNTMLEKNCVMMQCVNRNYEGDIKNQGDKVRIITPATLLFLQSVLVTSLTANYRLHLKI